MIPSKKALETLYDLILTARNEAGHDYTYDELHAEFVRNSSFGSLYKHNTEVGAAVSFAASQAVAAGISSASGISGGIVVAGHTAAFGFSAIVAPWFAIAEVARVGESIFSLYDLKDGKSGYPCICGGCRTFIGEYINTQEWKAAVTSVSPFLAGLPSVAGMIYDYRDKNKNDGRKRAARGIYAGANMGCTCAMAAVFVVNSDWAIFGGGDEGIMRRSVATIASEDGWERLL